MNGLLKKQIMQDYHEMLSREAGRRVFGGIFFNAGLNRPVGWKGSEAAAYEAGRRDLALAIANTIREADALGVAECELAYREFLKTYERDDDNGEYGDDGAD